MDEMQTPPPQVWPTLRATDARALIRFLVDAFGFEETAVHGDGDRVDHAELSWPLGGGVMLGSTNRGDDDPWALRPGTFGCYVVADDIDKLHERAVAAGAEITRAPFDTDYGSRDFAARDPEGNIWQFGTYRGEPRSVAIWQPALERGGDGRGADADVGADADARARGPVRRAHP